MITPRRSLRSYRAIAAPVAASLLLGLGLGGCHAKKPGRRAAAEIGNDVIYVDEIDEKITAEVFELRSMVLHKLIADKVLAQEAKRRKITLSELWKQEVDQKVPAADEATARRAMEQWVADGRITAAEAARITPQQAVERLRGMQTRAREDAYYDALVDAAAMKVDFAALGKPWLKVANDGPSLGPADAPITVVEFSDLSQPFTSMWQPTLEQLVEKYGKKVRFLFKQKPSQPDSAAGALAEASLCADEQHQYWSFRKALLHGGKAESVGAERIGAAAQAASLDGAAFKACMDSGRKKALIASNVNEARSNGLEGEPVVSVNGIRLSGAHSFATVDRLLRLETSKL